jgi:sulfate adenylyltransferase
MTGQLSSYRGRRSRSNQVGRSVVDTLRLADGTLFPMPVTLDVSREVVDRLSLAKDKRVTLRDPRDGQGIAILTS